MNVYAVNAMIVTSIKYIKILYDLMPYDYYNILIDYAIPIYLLFLSNIV